jgi:hypothetical protein
LTCLCPALAIRRTLVVMLHAKQMGFALPPGGDDWENTIVAARALGCRQMALAHFPRPMGFGCQ